MTPGVALVISAICIGHVGLSYYLMKEACLIGEHRNPERWMNIVKRMRNTKDTPKSRKAAKEKNVSFGNASSKGLSTTLT